MTHLGDQADALVDLQLDAAARDDAERHLEGCAQCRRLVADVEFTKSLLVAARSTTMTASPALLARLAQIPQSAAAQIEPAPVLAALGSGVRRPRSRRLLGRTPPSRPAAKSAQAGKSGKSTQLGQAAAAAPRRPVSLKTGSPATGRRVAVRSVAAAGFAASVVVGLGGAVSGSAAPAAAGTATAAPGNAVSASADATTGTVITLTALETPVRRPEGRTPVSVVYRRP